MTKKPVSLGETKAAIKKRVLDAITKYKQQTGAHALGWRESYVDEGLEECVTLSGETPLEGPKARYQGSLGTWCLSMSKDLELTEKIQRFVTITPLTLQGEPLLPIVIEVAQFWYIDHMPVKLIGTTQLQNGHLAVLLQADQQEFVLSGTDYWKLIHGDRAINRDYGGILEARFHEILQVPQSLIEDPGILLTPKQTRERRGR